MPIPSGVRYGHIACGSYLSHLGLHSFFHQWSQLKRQFLAIFFSQVEVYLFTLDWPTWNFILYSTSKHFQKISAIIQQSSTVNSKIMIHPCPNICLPDSDVALRFISTSECIIKKTKGTQQEKILRTVMTQNPFIKVIQTVAIQR